MKTKSVAGAVAGALLIATALSPVRAADMTNERALNPQREPQNWILHHGNYDGHRFSQLKEINTETVKNLKPVFTVALSGFQSGGRYPRGNLEATPLVEDGIMYVPDGWGSVYAIDLTAGKKAVIRWKMDPGTDRAWAGDVACCGVNNRGVALWKDKVISIALDGRMFAINKATGEVVWERKIAEPALGETITVAPLIVRDLAIVGAAGGEFGIRGYIEATDLNTGKAAWRTYTIPGTGEPATRPGRTARSAGSMAAARCGRPPLTMPTLTRSTRASATRAPTTTPNTDPATASGQRACSRFHRTTARSSGDSSTHRRTPTTTTRFPSIR
jgi:alcohol dehydrogenase (cytochrome c)